MPKRNVIWIAAILAAAAVLAWVAGRQPVTIGRAEPGEFDAVTGAYRLIKENYLKPADGAELRSGAVKGMVSKLDEFSTYVAPEDVEAFSHRITGMDRGLGLRLRGAQGQIEVIGALANSPAHKAGILAGDLLVAVDGRKVEDLAIEKVEALLAGPLGQKVVLTIMRGEGPARALTVARDEFLVESVQGVCRDSSGEWVYMLVPEKGLACVRLREFVNGTGARLREVLSRLEGLQGLVLDLRGNPGGILAESVASANVFLRSGVIATSAGRGHEPVVYRADPVGMLADFPMVVLIDGQTASAAEILAGAIKLHDRAVLVGSRTRGKGYVQTMYRLPGRLGQINLTTSELLIGRDTSLSRTAGSTSWGVDPHAGLEVLIPPAQQALLVALRVQAEVLPPPERASQRSRPPNGASRPASLADQIVALDAQLAKALELLEEPEKMDEIFHNAAAERQRLRETGPEEQAAGGADAANE